MRGERPLRQTSPAQAVDPLKGNLLVMLRPHAANWLVRSQGEADTIRVPPSGPGAGPYLHAVGRTSLSNRGGTVGGRPPESRRCAPKLPPLAFKPVIAPDVAIFYPTRVKNHPHALPSGRHLDVTVVAHDSGFAGLSVLTSWEDGLQRSGVRNSSTD